MIRARDLGIAFDGTPGRFNAITDVAGVEVGHHTLITDAFAREDGSGRVRTGVTVIHPRGRAGQGGVFAARATLNGTGEWTGMHLVDEIGRVYGPIGLTGTGNLGMVHRALTEWAQSLDFLSEDERYMRLLAVVGETLDSQLNDVFACHLTPADVFAALNGATSGPVAEGNVGGGTGMAAYEFKGGIGTASRTVTSAAGTYTVGTLIQANHARRNDLVIAGVNIGSRIDTPLPNVAHDVTASGSARRSDRTKSSLLVTLATDAPLMPSQLQRLARRVAMGIGRNGSTANNVSGELSLAFSTAPIVAGMTFIDDLDSETMNLLFASTVQAVEEALVNQLVASEDMLGNGNVVIRALPHDALVDILGRFHRLNTAN